MGETDCMCVNICVIDDFQNIYDIKNIYARWARFLIKHQVKQCGQVNPYQYQEFYLRFKKKKKNSLD